MGHRYSTVREIAIGSEPQIAESLFRFLVEEYSDLYYDPTPLFEVVGKLKEEEGGGSSTDPSQSQAHLSQHPQQHQPLPHMNQFNMGSPRHQTPMRNDRGEFLSQMGGQQVDPSPLRHGHGAPGMQGNFPYPPSPGNMGMRGQPGQGGFPGGGGVPGPTGPFNPMQQQQQQQQFFPGRNPAPSPIRMGSIGGLNMDDHGMGHPGMAGMGGMPMGGGGMPGMGGQAPNMARRMTRGMGDEGFPMNQ